MPSTVIDSLVVTLGLDPTKFTQGQKDAIASMRRLQDEADKNAKGTEDRNKRVTDSVQELQSNVLKAFALFAGGKGIGDFLIGLNRADAAVGRLSRNVGIGVNDISKWQSVARIFGGSAEGMATSFKTISDAFAGWRAGVSSPLIADLRALGAAGGTVIDLNKGVAQSFLDMAANIKAIHDRDPALAGFWGTRLGLDPGLFDAMITGSMAKVLELTRNLGAATKDTADAAGELEKRWNAIGIRIEQIGRESGLAGAIVRTADFLNKPAAEAFGDIWNYFFGKDAWSNDAYRKQRLGGASSVPVRKMFGAETGSPAFANDADRESFIRREAGRRGINPDVAVAVWKSEGKSAYVGDRGSSFGPYQLHYGGVASGGMAATGLGDTFTKQTGLDARDPATEQAQIKFALDQAASGGWGPWHGWKGAPDAGGAGRGGRSGGDINIETVTINTQATDASGIMRDLSAGVVKRQSSAANSNDGQN